MSILISFLYLLLHIAIILFVAACIVWVLRWIGIAIDPMVYKIGQAIVGLLVLIVVVVWLASLLGYAGARFPWWADLKLVDYRTAFSTAFALQKQG